MSDLKVYVIVCAFVAVIPVQMAHSQIVAGISPSVRASTVSKAAEKAEMAASLVNIAGVSELARQKLLEHNDVITQALRTTGQNGVLVTVRVEQTYDANGTVVYSLVGGDVDVVGAGTDPVAVLTTDKKKAARFSGQVQQGYKIAPEMSRMFWFSVTKEDNTIQATIYPYGETMSQAIKWTVDSEILLAYLTAQNTSGIEAAIRHIEATTSKDDLRAKIAGLNAKKLVQDMNVVEIERQLKRDLDAARAGNAVAATFDLIGGALTLAGKAALLSESMGRSAPEGLNSIESPEEFNGVLGNWVGGLQDEADRTAIEFKEMMDDINSVHDEFQNILINEHYDLDMVPQITLDTPP